jgi:chromate transporter
MNSVSLLSIFSTFFRIGLFTLGGGLAMSPVMRHELVIKRQWVKDADFMSIMSLATVVPGAIAVNIAYLLGRRLRAKRGSLVAVLGTILPSFFVILFIAVFLLPFFDYPKVAAFLHGCAIAVAGQLAFAGFIFSRKLLRRWQHFVVCAAAVIIVGVFRLHPLWGLITAGGLGFWLCPANDSKGACCDTNAD